MKVQILPGLCEIAANQNKKKLIKIVMFFNAITFKDSATPFAEALVELHHEIMFYLIVIVSVVIFILVNAINITRVRESYFYANVFSSLSFLKAFFLNFVFSSIFNKFLFSSYYSKLYSQITDLLINFVYVLSLKGSSYFNYFFKTIFLTKSLTLKFLLLFSKIESSLSRVFGDYRNLGPKTYFLIHLFQIIIFIKLAIQPLILLIYLT